MSLETAYYISGIILTVISAIGLFQLVIIKHESTIKFRRQSLDIAIKIVERYLTNYVKISDAFDKECKILKIPPYLGTIKDLPIIDKGILTLRVNSSLEWHKIFNELEIISVSVLSGTSDDDFVFKSIGRSFCTGVARNYDILKSIRSWSVPCPYYDNLWELFYIWRAKLLKIELKHQKNKTEDELAKIIEKTICKVK